MAKNAAKTAQKAPGAVPGPGGGVGQAERPKRAQEPPGGRWPASKVEARAVDKLVPYARNARVHSEEQISQVAASIQRFGFTIPVLVDEHGTIIAGHARVRAAKKIGLGEVPVMVARGWSEPDKRAYVIADNKLAENADWDKALLGLELRDLRDAGYDLALTGFDADALVTFLSDKQSPEEFKDVGDAVETDHKCPRCGYAWSGKA